MKQKASEFKKVLQADKRKTERLLSLIKIFYKVPPADEWLGPFSIQNISGDGLGFVTAKKLEKDSVLLLKLFFPEEHQEPIMITATVCWVMIGQGGYWLGVKFHKMNYGDRKRYVAYLSEKILSKIADIKQK